MELIEDISANAQGLTDSKDQLAIASIYRIAHSVLSPACLRNHPSWDEPIKALSRSGSASVSKTERLGSIPGGAGFRRTK